MTKRLILALLTLGIAYGAGAQEIWFFSEGTGPTYYDQGLVDVPNLGASAFEHTFPPGSPQYNDKIPCSPFAFSGSTALKFNYTSAAYGNWKATIFRSGWAAADITGMDSLSFYAYSTVDVPSSALPRIGLVAIKKGGSAEVNSKLYLLSEFNSGIPASKWTRISFPLGKIFSDTGNSEVNFSATKAVIFNQSETNNTSRLILIDELLAFKSLAVVPGVSELQAAGFDSHAELTWVHPLPNLSYRIYASFDNGKTFELRGVTTENYYLDFVPAYGKNTTVQYKVVSLAQGRESLPSEAVASIRDFSDDELLDMVQRYTFRYFWQGAHQASGMALERTDGSKTTAASGATGMGLMAMIAAHERGYRPREDIKDRIISILAFLENCERHHGAWSHWYNADTYKTQPFSTDDDGGDLVETSFVAQALIALKNYFIDTDAKSRLIREKSDFLWKSIEWDWYRQGGQNVLYWHWSPKYYFSKNMKITGWNECLITYVMAASSPTYGIPKEVYTQGWARNGNMVRKRTYYGLEINLSPDWGGPLFWIQYSHLGINPNDLKDAYADYWKEHVNTVKIHQAYAIANPLLRKNYSDKCWGLTASDDPFGYTAHQPNSNDNGTISPTAALASMPFAPDEVLKALKYFYRERGKELFGKYGPYDAFNDDLNWVKKAYIGIDQGPIMVMIENYRSGLLWNNFMKDADVRSGLDKLGFQYRTTSVVERHTKNPEILIYPNPCKVRAFVNLNGFGRAVTLKLFSQYGSLIFSTELPSFTDKTSIECEGLSSGLYIVQVSDGQVTINSGLLISK